MSSELGGSDGKRLMVHIGIAPRDPNDPIRWTVSIMDAIGMNCMDLIAFDREFRSPDEAEKEIKYWFRVIAERHKIATFEVERKNAAKLLPKASQEKIGAPADDSAQEQEMLPEELNAIRERYSGEVRTRYHGVERDVNRLLDEIAGCRRVIASLARPPKVRCAHWDKVHTPESHDGSCDMGAPWECVECPVPELEAAKAEAELYRRGYAAMGAADISEYLALCDQIRQSRNKKDAEARLAIARAGFSSPPVMAKPDADESASDASAAEGY